MPNYSSDRSNLQAFLLGFRWGVREFFYTARLIWRVVRFAFHVLKCKVSSSEACVNARTFRAAFVEGCKSGSYEFWTPLRFTWRLIQTGFGKVVRRLRRNRTGR